MIEKYHINWYYIIWFKVISFLCQSYFLFIYFTIKYQIFFESFRIKIIEFGAKRFDAHLDWLQNKNFWNGTQAVHSNVFYLYIDKCIKNKQWHIGNYTNENERIKEYFEYILFQYKNMLLIGKHIFESKVIVEKVILSKIKN